MGTQARMRNQAARFVNSRFSDLVKPFTFEVRTDTPDGQGGFTSTWATFATVAGFVKNAKEDERILDDHLKSDRHKSFSFESIPGIDADMRILYDGVYFNIEPTKNIRDSDIWIIVVGVEDVAT